MFLIPNRRQLNPPAKGHAPVPPHSCGLKKIFLINIFEKVWLALLNLRTCMSHSDSGLDS